MIRIILTGTKGSGKSTVGKRLGSILGVDVVETDDLTERIYEREHGRPSTCRDICRELGEPAFRELEKRAVFEALDLEGDAIICTGGQTLVNDECRAALAEAGLLVFLKVRFDVVWARITAGGWPSYFPESDHENWYRKRYNRFNALVEPVADVVLDVSELSIQQTVEKVLEVVRGSGSGTNRT